MPWTDENNCVAPTPTIIDVCGTGSDTLMIPATDKYTYQFVYGSPASQYDPEVYDIAAGNYRRDDLNSNVFYVFASVVEDEPMFGTYQGGTTTLGQIWYFESTDQPCEPVQPQTPAAPVTPVSTPTVIQTSNSKKLLVSGVKELPQTGSSTVAQFITIILLAVATYGAVYFAQNVRRYDSLQ